MTTATKIVLGVAAWAALGAAWVSTAHAQGFVDEPVCYSWNGGHKSAGSFSKCEHWVVVAPRPVPAVAPPTPVVAAPIMPMVQQTCAPPPRPVIRRHRPAPKPVCK
jgi:hypothetical protein